MALLERFVMGVDIQSFSSRAARLQRLLQRALDEMLDDAAEAAGMDRARWDRRADGDGETAALPPDTDLIAVVRRFVTALDERLADHNEDYGAEAEMRLRIAMHTDAITDGRLGHAGPALITLSRLLDSTPVRTALKDNPEANLAQIISEPLFQRAVVPELGGLRPRQFERVRVYLPEKGFDQPGYLYVPGVRPPRRITEQAERLGPERRQGQGRRLGDVPRQPALGQWAAPPREIQPPPQEQLAPELGALAERIREALGKGDLRWADTMTTEALLFAAGRIRDGWLRADDGARLPDALLAELDRAWAKASSGAWGFQAQRDRLAEHGLAGSADFRRICQALGWCRSDQDVLPPYAQFLPLATTDRPFFPTLRSPTREQHPEWPGEWGATVTSVQARLLHLEHLE